MAPPTTASEPDSSAAAPGAVQLLLRNIDSRTTVVRAQREDTVGSVLGRLGVGVARRGDLQVLYAGRDLPRESTIGELGLPPGATLHVTARLVSTPHLDSRNLAKEVAHVARLAATGHQAAAASLDQLVNIFFRNAIRHAHGRKPISPLGPVADILSVFLRSDAAGVLGHLYLSGHAAWRFGAERTMRRFLPPPTALPEHGIVRVCMAPLLLEFSCAIAAGARQGDPLYADLRCALAATLVVPEWKPVCWLGIPQELVAAQLTRFVGETASAVTAHIGGAYGRGPAEANKYLAEFKAFSTALRRQLPEPDAHGPCRPWRTALYETLVSLLRSADECMAMLDTRKTWAQHVAAASLSARRRWTAAVPSIWAVLVELDAWSETDHAWPELRGALRATLTAHDEATRAIVMGLPGTEWTQSAGWVARHRDLLGFEARRHLAMTVLPKLAAATTNTSTPHAMLVDRSRLLSDSFRYIAHAAPEKLRAGLFVEFKHEYATGPGVRKEWFCMVFQALFNPRQVLFSACPSDRRRFFVNPTSVVDPLHLPYYQFAGRMIALALMHNIPVGVLFDRTLFLLLAARPVTLDDIADADPSLHASCRKILEMDPSLVDSNVLGLTFVREIELLGSRRVTELISGGKDTAVNSENRSNYIHLLIQDRFVNSTRDQLAYLSFGFNSMFGRWELSKYFFEALDVEDFNQMLGGSKDTIDVKEWRAHTDYSAYKETSCQVICNAAGVLGQLYLSEHAECRVGAERAIRSFLPPLFTLPEHGIAKVWTAPVLLEFCCAIAAGARQADPLYADLRRALAAILVVPEWEPACWLDMPLELVAAQLTRFVADTANAVTAHIGGAYGSSAEANKHLAEFKAFSTALRRQLPEPPDAHGPWRTALYETLVSLLRSAEEFMAMFDMSLASSSSSARLRWTTSVPLVWTVLLELDAWSEIEYAWPELRGALRATVAAHDAATGALVMGVDGTEWTQSAGSWIARHRDLLGFEARRHLAMTMLPKLAAAVGGHKMLVDRSRLLSDSFGSIAHATPEKLRAGLSVEFKHEYATGPGVRREWFCMVLQALFNQRQVLFSACPSDRRRFFVNPTSVVDPLHLPYYQFAGRMIALALMHNIPVGVLFDRTLFLLLATRPVTLDDIADADPSLHANCKKILEMDPSLVDSNLLGLTFVRETELLGSRTVTELISGGKDTIVNSENRSNYIHLLIQDRFVNCTRDQLAYFSLGFNSMFGRRELPKYFFEALDVEDFNQMLGGSKDTIDVKEWRAHTDYNGYRETSRRVKWFWKVVKAMTVEQQRLLLFFWTSVKYLPFDGFSGLGSRLSIFRSPNSCDHLPTSGTCFYKLNLPAYTSFDMMQSRLQMIVQEHVSSGFGKS
ncbi:hypothetical protein EJB05_48400, partial [Eragrostis curvula]